MTSSSIKQFIGTDVCTVEPPNKGHFGSRAFVLLRDCPLMGGSSQYPIYSLLKT